MVLQLELRLEQQLSLQFLSDFNDPLSSVKGLDVVGTDSTGFKNAAGTVA